jgi:hypothetical protein
MLALLDDNKNIEYSARKATIGPGFKGGDVLSKA